MASSSSVSSATIGIWCPLRDEEASRSPSHCRVQPVCLLRQSLTCKLQESNIVVSIKGVHMSTAALSNSTAVYNGPLFLALDYFGHESDDVAIGGTEVPAIWLLPAAGGGGGGGAGRGGGGGGGGGGGRGWGEWGLGIAE